MQICSKLPRNLVKILNEGGYSKQQISNVGRAASSWSRMLSGTCIDREAKSIPGFKVSKDRPTLLLGANAITLS